MKTKPLSFEFVFVFAISGRMV